MDINHETDALIVVDMQNDFTDTDGALYVGGATSIIPTINRIIEAFEDAEASVFYTQDWHPKESAHFEEWPEHCVKDTWGAEINEEIKILEDGVFIKKGTEPDEDGYSAFRTKNVKTNKQEVTELDEILRENEVERIFICGVATDYCVKNTAIDSAKAGYDTYVIENAIKAVDREPGDEAAALQDMSNNGAALATVE